jgi:hypothetical protein
MRVFPLSNLIPCDHVFADSVDYLTSDCCHVTTASLCRAAGLDSRI